MSSTNQKNQSFDILINKTNNSKLSNQKSFFEKDFNNFQNMKVDDSIFKKQLMFSNMNNKKRKFSELLNTSNSTYPTMNTNINKSKNSILQENRKDYLYILKKEKKKFKRYFQTKIK